jgi:urease accessory protein
MNPVALDAIGPVGVEHEPTSRQAGCGCLQVVRFGSRSLVTRALARSPLKLLTPRNHGTAAWVYTSTYGGGLVDGDALRLVVEIGEDATALLATQAATKVYRSPGGTSVDVVARVRDGGLLVVAPDPVVCFAGSSYRQTQRFELHGTAGLVLIDWLTSGRRAFGERWQFERYESLATVTRHGRLMLFDALSLSRDEGALATRMGRFETVCLVTLIGPRLEADAAHLIARVSQMPVGRRADLLVGASAIVGGGAVLKVMGISLENVSRVVREHLQFVPALLGDDPWARKW